jgi:hypothetical protein
VVLGLVFFCCLGIFVLDFLQVIVFCKVALTVRRLRSSV